MLHVYSVLKSRWSKKFTFCKLLYHRKCKRRGVGGQKKVNFVNEVCERPLSMSWSVTCIFCRWSKYSFNAFHTMKELFFSRRYLQNWILCLFWSRFVFVKDAHARLKHHNILLCYLYCYWPAGRHLVSCCAGINLKKLSRSSVAYTK